MANYEPLLHVVLYQPEIPQNTGNVGRTCVAIGAKLWLVRPLGFRIDAKNLRRAGLDYWKFLDWEVVSHWTDIADRFANQRVWYFTKTATRSYASVPFERGDAFVFGSESNGLPLSLLQEKSDWTLQIPIRPEVRSLNLSNSVAIAVYEAQRQWGFP